MAEGSPPRLGLRAAAAWTVSANVLFALSQWLMLVLMAKLLAPAAVGRFALALAVTAPVVMLANMQLRSVLGADSAHLVPLDTYLRTRVMSTGAALAVLSVVAGFWPWPTGRVILLVAGMKAVEAGIDILQGLFQNLDRMDIIARSRLLRGLGSVAGMAVGLTMAHSLDLALGLVLVTWLAVGFLYDLPRFRRFRYPPPAVSDVGPSGRRRLGALIRRALPLGVAAALGSLQATVPRLVLERSYDESELGLYAALAYLVVAGSLVVDSVSEASLPRLARWYQSSARPRFDRLLRWLLALGLAVGGAGLLIAATVGPPLLRLLYQEDYVRQDVLLWVMVAAACSYMASPLNWALVAVGRFRAQLWAALAVLGVLIISSLLLIPGGGSRGAAQAQAAGALAQLLVTGGLTAAAVVGKGRSPAPPAG